VRLNEFMLAILASTDSYRFAVQALQEQKLLGPISVLMTRVHTVLNDGLGELSTLVGWVGSSSSPDVLLQRLDLLFARNLAATSHLLETIRGVFQAESGAKGIGQRGQFWRNAMLLPPVQDYVHNFDLSRLYLANTTQILLVGDLLCADVQGFMMVHDDKTALSSAGALVLPLPSLLLPALTLLYFWRWHLLHVINPVKTTFVLKKRPTEKGALADASLVFPWGTDVTKDQQDAWRVDFCAGEGLNGTEILEPLVHLLQAGPLKAEVFTAADPLLHQTVAYLKPADSWALPVQVAMWMSAKKLRTICAIHAAAFQPPDLFSKLAPTARHHEYTRKTAYASLAALLETREALGIAAALAGLGTPAAPVHAPSKAEVAHQRQMHTLRLQPIMPPAESVSLCVSS